MTKEEILKYNKLCAEFIGAKPCEDWQGYDAYEHPDWCHNVWSNKYQDYIDIDTYTVINLKFHEDWDWIMNVVGAIQKLNIDEYGLGEFVVNYSNRQGHYLEIRDRNCYDTKIEDGWGETIKEAYVNCINNFLNWYKEENKQK